MEHMERYADPLDLAQAHTEQETRLAIHRIRLHTTLGSGRCDCIDCGERIPAQRQAQVPNATRCAPCQGRWEREHAKRWR
jgi:phage/conjugal plasmid C-4 type zinc finger TraR family protein